MPAILRRHVQYPPRPRPTPVVVPYKRVVRLKATARPWTDVEVADLHKLCAEGHSYIRIGELIGRSEASVYRKAVDLKIPKKPSHCGPRRAV